MQLGVTRGIVGIFAAIALSACAAAEKIPATQGQAYSGWYMQHAQRRTFQPCGQSQEWSVSESADLPARAKAFGLQQDTPVYVRLIGSAHGDEIKVSRVEQFGSPTPVSNCAMTGVVIPTPPPASN